MSEATLRMRAAMVEEEDQYGSYHNLVADLLIQTLSQRKWKEIEEEDRIYVVHNGLPGCETEEIFSPEGDPIHYGEFRMHGVLMAQYIWDRRPGYEGEILAVFGKYLCPEHMEDARRLLVTREGDKWA